MSGVNKSTKGQRFALTSLLPATVMAINSSVTRSARRGHTSSNHSITASGMVLLIVWAI